MKKNPKISVIVPIYKVEKYLEQCIDSIIRQTYKNLEIILVDDGSPDRCPAICDDYAQKDSRVIVIHQKNTGAPRALNNALSRAKGKYVWFIDSDDFVEKDALSVLVEKAEKNCADMVIFGARTVDFKTSAPNNQQVDYWSLSKIDKKFTQQTFTYQDTIDWLINIPTVPWNKFHRREFLVSHHIKFDTDLLAPYDAFFNLCCYLDNAKIIIYNQVLYNYRLSPQSTTAKLVANGSHQWAQPILLAQKTDELIKKKNVIEKLYGVFVKRNLLHLNFWFRRAQGSAQRKFYCKMRKYFKSLDKSIYTKENILQSGLYEFYSEILHTPFWLYYFKQNPVITTKITPLKTIKKFGGIEFLKIKQNAQNKKIYLLGIQIYHKKLTPSTPQKINTEKEDSKKILDQFVFLTEELKKMQIEIYNLRVLVKAQTCHAYLAKYRNMYKGKELVILATGPSSKYYIPKENCIHIGVNGATRFKNVKLNYLFVQDQARESQMNEDANKYDCVKFFGHHADIRAKTLFPDVKRIPMSTRLKTNAHIYLIEDKSWGNFAYDISVEPFGDFHSTVFSALQFALYTNPSKIYLVGCDCSQGYFYNSSVPFVNSKNVLKGWNLFKQFKDLIYPDTEIISINPVGLKGMFTDIYEGKNEE